MWLGLGTDLGTFKGTDRIAIHIKSFGTWERIWAHTWEREREKETLWHDVTPATM